MLAKIKQLFVLLRLVKNVKEASPEAEKDGAKRFLKVLVLGVLALTIQSVASQNGPDCTLGPMACKVLKDPMVGTALVALLAGIEKWVNEKWGVSIGPLDSKK